MSSKLQKSSEGHLVNTFTSSLILTVLTLTLRFVWNFFRLENEHLNNCGQFRVVRDISIAPVDMKVIMVTTMMVFIGIQMGFVGNVSKIGEIR